SALGRQARIGGTRTDDDPMGVVAPLVWHHKVATKRRTCLQLNDIATGCTTKNLLETLPGTYRPTLAACRGVFQRALYKFSGQLCWAIGIFAIGRHGRLTGRGST